MNIHNHQMRALPVTTRHVGRKQDGVATLVVVMVLFFVISLVAAYTSRNLIFEQRTSANQSKSTLATEAAESGLQWAIAMLNSGRIGSACEPSVNTADSNFKRRYLNIDSSTGYITPRLQPTSGGPLFPSCVFNGTDWQCGCPSDALPTLITPTGTGPFPAFRVRFVTLARFANDPPAKPGIVRIEVNGCSHTDVACLDFPDLPTGPVEIPECGGTICAKLALFSGLKAVPLAAVTTKGNLNVGGSALNAVNGSAGTSGITIQAGGLVNSAGLTLQGSPGTPGNFTYIENDPGLSNPAFGPARMFASIFGVWKSTYWQQPAAVLLSACTPCSAASVRTVASLNPDRVILVQGDLALEGGDIGSLNEPVILIITGSVTFSAPTNFYGYIYSQAADWTTSGTGLVAGAISSEGNIIGTGSFSVVYDKDILTKLHWQTGSFARIPGSWRDYK